MSESAFKIGDIVALMSGSPPLTVSMIETECIVVQWFRGAEVMKDGFHPNMLMPYQPTMAAKS